MADTSVLEPTIAVDHDEDGPPVAEVYGIATQTQIDEHYTKWAATYDAELTASGFHAPHRCAVALARFVPSNAPVLDVGCGTGLSGRALVAAGFVNVSGHDVNAEMVTKAKALDLYRELTVGDPANPFLFQPGTYRAMTASGVISPGAAPASLLVQMVGAMAPGGLIAFTFTDYAMQDPGYARTLDDVLTSGSVEVIFEEYGPHIDEIGLCSKMYVLRILR